jgi:hypothetical protein
MSNKPPANPTELNSDTLSAAAAEMDVVLGQQPALTGHGFEATKATNFKRNRDYLRENEALAAFIAARHWLAAFPKIKTFSQKGTSYGLKHVAENEIGYLANGVFIAAAIAEGFRIARMGDSPNVLLNISSKAWRRADEGNLFNG